LISPHSTRWQWPDPSPSLQFQVAMRRHTDSGRGGSKSKFMGTAVAFERLVRPGGYYHLYDSDYDDDDNPQLGWHYRFFGARIHFGDGNLVVSDRFAREYKPWSEQSSEERKRIRDGNIKNMIDWRDTAEGGEDQRCMTCCKRDGITEKCAKKSGLCWAEYKSHPDGLITCWACRNAHKSVMPVSLSLHPSIHPSIHPFIRCSPPPLTPPPLRNSILKLPQPNSLSPGGTGHGKVPGPRPKAQFRSQV